MWRLNNTLLKSDWVKEGEKDATKRHRETNKKDKMTHANFRDAVKAEEEILHHHRPISRNKRNS